MLDQLEKTYPGGDPNHSPFCFQTDTKGNILSVSSNILHFTGLNKNELIGLSLQSIIEESGSYQLNTFIEKNGFQNGKPVEVFLKGKTELKKISFVVDNKKDNALLEWTSVSEEDNNRIKAHLDWFRKLFDQSPQPVVVYNPDSFGIFFANKATENFYGYTENELRGLKILDLVLPQDIPEIMDTIGKVKYESFQSSSYYHIRKDREKIRVQLSANPVDINGKLFRILFVNDYSEKLKHEEEKRLSSEISNILGKAENLETGLGAALAKLRSFVGWELLDIWICHNDSKKIIKQSVSTGNDNPELKDLANAIIPSHLQERTAAEIFLQPQWITALDQQPDFFRSSAAIKAGFASAISYPIIHGDKLVAVLFMFHEKAIPVVQETFDLLEPVSKQFASEIERRKTENQLEKFFLLSNEYLCILSPEGNFRKVNDSFANLLGYTEKELVNKSCVDFIEEEDRERSLKAFTTYVDTDASDGNFENRYKCKNGQIKWLSWSGTILHDEGLILAAARDITSRKTTEEKLLRKTEELNNVVSSLDDIVFEYDQEGHFQKVWCRDESMLQMMPTLFLGKSMQDAFAALPELVGPFIEDFEKALWNNEICYRDFVMNIGSETRWFNSKISPLFNGDGSSKGFTQRITDISEKKKVELAIVEKNEELKNAHRELKEIIENASEIIFKLDQEGKFIFVSPEFERALGYSCSEILGRYFGAIIHPDDLAACEEGLATIKKTGTTATNVIFRVTGKDKKDRWFSTSVTFLNDENGKPFVGIGLAQDISNLKQTMDSLASAEERYAAFIQQSSEGIWCVETGMPLSLQMREEEMSACLMEYGYLSECNDVFARMYGYENASEISQVSFRKLFSSTDEGILQNIKAFIRSGFKLSNAESKHLDKNGEKKFFLNNVIGIIKDGMLLRIWGTQKDITEQRYTEEILRISEERYRSVVDALGEGIVMHDQNGTMITCNQSAEKILGTTKRKLVGKDIFQHQWEAIHEDGTPFPLMQFPSFITGETGKPLQNVVMGIFREDSSLCWISINTEPVYYTSQTARPDAVVASFVDITQKKYAEEELIKSGQQLRDYSDRITNILDSITDGFIAVDNELNILLWNHIIEKVTGIKTSEAVGKNISSVLLNLGNSLAYQQYMDAIVNKTTVNFEHYIQSLNLWFETSAYPSRQGLFIYFKDITHRKKQENLLALEKKVLEINASSSASLKLTVDYFLEGIENIFPGMICSVLTLDEDSQSVHHLSAPSLPVEFSSAVDGARIGPRAGSCGTAMYTKRPVITREIATDPLWEYYKPLADQFNLQSCWSFPILNAQQEVLATIAAYYRYPSAPTSEDIDILERVRNLLRIIIENKKAEAKIRISNERYILATKATNDAIWDWDFISDNLFRGEGYFNLFGYKPGYVSRPLARLEAAIHPDDKERVLNGLKEFITGTHHQIWEEEYRFRKADGNYVLVFDRGFLIYNQEGKINRMVGSMQDITEKKELEKQLLKQELDKQKLVAQAVVDAQEKERADIGKELHDNVNQILSTAKLYLELAKSDDGERINLIKRSTDNIYNAINEIRSISRSLVPASIGDLGIIESIQDLVENTRATKKLHVEFYYHEGIDDLISEKQKLMLFRIIQEQVNNVLKHSDAQNLTIELMVDGTVVELTISDNGKGFESDKIKNKKGLGLYNIASRTELFNGKVKIVSAPGKGCTVNIRVPISNF